MHNFEYSDDNLGENNTLVEACYQALACLIPQELLRQLSNQKLGSDINSGFVDSKDILTLNNQATSCHSQELASSAINLMKNMVEQIKKSSTSN